MTRRCLLLASQDCNKGVTSLVDDIARIVLSKCSTDTMCKLRMVSADWRAITREPLAIRRWCALGSALRCRRSRSHALREFSHAQEHSVKAHFRLIRRACGWCGHSQQPRPFHNLRCGGHGDDGHVCHVRYCSRDCQRAAWLEGHRLLCPVSMPVFEEVD